MKKLMDIKGFWNMSDNWELNDQDMWEGNILLEDDGWFEGIVTEPYSSYQKDQFVFGIYYPTKIIELFKIVPTHIGKLLVFRGIRDAKGYDGYFKPILFGTAPYGRTHIITQYRENIETEIQNVEDKIEKYKNNLMDEADKKFYENIISTKINMKETILRKYQKRKL